MFEVWGWRPLIATLRCTGVGGSELVAIRLEDVDVDRCQIRVDRGNGDRDRVAPFPYPFNETLALHTDATRHWRATYRFTSS